LRGVEKGGKVNSLVVYDSQYGNTERAARTIASGLSQFGEARAVNVKQAQPSEFREIDLLILGCPIQGWKPSPGMLTFVERISSESLKGPKVACFDTRLQWPSLLRGSAADWIAKKLRAIGVEPLVRPEGFLVNGTKGPLKDGEEERAANWARTLREKYETS
jgi:flavodoxin